MYSFMDVDTIPEPQEDVFPISPSPANEEHPPGSSDEDESDDEEEEAGSKGERLRRGADDMTILDIDDELADDKVQARTRHLYDFRGFLDSDGSTRSVKLRLAKYSEDGTSAEGSSALLMRCAGAPGTDEEESEEEFKEEGKEEEEGAGGRSGSGVPGNEGEESREDGGVCGSGTDALGANSEEEERGGDGGSTNRNEMRRGVSRREGG